MAARALRIGRLKQKLVLGRCISSWVSDSILNSPDIRASGLHRECGSNVGLLFVARRALSSTGLQSQQAPSELDEGERKKPILGLNFLSKLFGQSQEPPPPAAGEAEQELVEESPELQQGEAYEEAQIAEAAGELVEGEPVEMEPVEGENVVEEGQVLEVHGQLLEPEIEGGQHVEAVDSEAQLAEAQTEPELAPVEAEVTEENSFEESLRAAAAVEMKAKSESAAKLNDISTSVEEFLRTLPPILPAGEVPAAVEKPAKVPEEKPRVLDEKSKVSEAKPTKASEEKPAAAEAAPPEKTKASEEKAAAPVVEKPKPGVTPATKKPVESQAAAPAEKKPVAPKKSVASSIPEKTPKPPTTPDTSQSPVLEFLRSRIRENHAGGGSTTTTTAAAAAAAADKPKPAPTKVPREALSTADKTTAAINLLLETVDKSTKSPAAPIFDALDALKSKEKEAPAAPTPSLRLSLSSAPVEPAPMDRQALMGEMNFLLTDQKPEEAVRLFEEWRKGIDPHTMECNRPDRALYNLYMQAKLKLMASYSDLHNLVSEMEEAGMPKDLAAYNILIRALFRQKDSATAEKIIETMEMEESQAQPDADSYNLVAVLCALDRKVVTAKSYMKKMLDKGFEPSRTTVNEILIAAARSHQTHLAAEMLKDLKATGKLPMPLLNTCAELMMAGSEVDDAECTRLALAAISERPMAKFGPKMILDEGTMICVLGTAARTRDAVLCANAWEALASHSRGIGKLPSPEAFHARIHALASMGDVAAAFKAVWELELSHGRSNELEPESFSPFTCLKSLASVCSRGGASALDSAYYTLEEAHNKKQGVSVAAINCIILGCGNLWDSERAFQTFEAIENVFGLRPDIHSCNALIHALGRTKLTEDALKVYDYIKEAGFKPDRWTYMLLSDAHVVNHDSNAAIDILQTMIDAGQQPFRQTTLKVWNRCRQYDDSGALERLSRLEERLNYRQSAFPTARRKLLLDVLRT